MVSTILMVRQCRHRSRCRRRTRPHAPLSHLHIHLVNNHLRPPRMLDVEFLRLGLQTRRPRLRRGHTGPHRLRLRSTSLLPDARQASWPRNPRAQLPPAQRHPRRHRHGLPVGRLVRVQRGLCAKREPARCDGCRRDKHRCGCWWCYVVSAGL